MKLPHIHWHKEFNKTRLWFKWGTWEKCRCGHVRYQAKPIHWTEMTEKEAEEESDFSFVCRMIGV